MFASPRRRSRARIARALSATPLPSERRLAALHPQVLSLEARVMLFSTGPDVLGGAPLSGAIATGTVVTDRFAPDAASAPAPLLADTSVARHPLTSLPKLSSLPGAPASLYIDLDGDSARTWGYYNITPQHAFDLDGDATTFTDTELEAIEEIWSIVADDYSPFNLNVTTVDPGPGHDGPGQMLRVVAGGDGSWFPEWIGGIATYNAFLSSENWVYAFGAGWPKDLATVIAHEAGHGFGLSHQSGYDESGTWQEYRRFPQDLPAAIMSGTYNGRMLWWYGPSGNPTTYQDDMAVVARAENGFGYRADDHGNSASTATPLALAPSAQDGGALAASASGILHHHTDEDWFSFNWAGGPITILADGTPDAATLDPRLQLRSSGGGTLIVDSDDLAIGATIVQANLPAGAYRVVVASGRHADGNTITRYGETGQYTLRLVGANLPGGQYPVRGVPFGISATTSSRIAIPDFDRGGEGISWHDADGLSGRMGRPGAGPDLFFYEGEGYALASGYVSSGDWLEYTANVASGGTYDVAFRLSGLGTGASLHLEVDGVNVTGALAVPPTMGADSFRDVVVRGVTLPGGRHVLRLVADAAPFQSIGSIRSIEFFPAAAGGQAPFGAGALQVSASSTTTLQLENFDTGGEGVAWHDTTPSQNTGGKYRTSEGVDIKTVPGETGNFRISDAKAGEWLEYALNVATSGMYDLQFRVSSPTAGGRFHAEIDGQNITGSIATPVTGSFDSYTLASVSGVALAAGSTVLRLVFDAESASAAAGGFDALRIAPAAKPAVSISAVDPVLSHVRDPAVLRFTRTGSTLSDLWVRYAATSPDELYKFSGFSGAAKIPAGASSADVQIFPGSYSGDIIDADATATLLPDAFYTIASPASATVNFDADAPPGVWLVTGNTSLAERITDSGTFVIMRSSTQGPLAVHYTVGGSATPGADYAALPGTATFADGEGYAYIAVNPVNDALVEGDETVTLTLQPGSGYNVAQPSSDSLLLMDDDLAPPPPAQQPFKGSPFAIGPGITTTIEAEDFDLGGEGVAYHDTDAANTGGGYRTGEGVDVKLIGGTSNQYRISSTKSGEWTEYAISVSAAGSYRLDLRVSDKSAGARAHVEVDGIDVTAGGWSIPDTGSSWDAMVTLSKTITLGAGQHVLRLCTDAVSADGSGGSYDWLRVAPLAPASTTLLVSTASYVRGGSYASSNFGGDSDLIVKRAGTTTNTRETYLKLDLSSISSITSAKLRLYGGLSDSSDASIKTGIYSAVNTSWSETSLTWNNKPSAGSTLRGSFTVIGTGDAWYEVDLSSFLKSELAAGRKVVTLVLKNSVATSAQCVFASDDTFNGPRLVIT